MQSCYSINQLIKTNTNIENKYVFISSVNGEIKLSNNIWDISLNTYIYTNSFLPDNIYEADITLPFAKISNVQLIKTKNNFDIEQQNNLDEYSCEFQVDIANSNLLSSTVTSLNIPIVVSYFLNSNVLSSTPISADSSTINGFKNELESSTKKMSFNYFNTVEVTNNKYVPFPNKIKIDSENGFSYVGEQLYLYPTKSYEENLISDIVDISSTNICVTQVSSIVNYNVSGKSSSFSSIDKTENKINGKQKLSINGKYKYSASNNSFIEDINGENGLWFVNGGFGDIESIVKIEDQHSNVLTIHIKNNFNFQNSLSLSNIELKKDEFKLDENFIEEVYYD